MATCTVSMKSKSYPGHTHKCMGCASFNGADQLHFCLECRTWFKPKDDV